MTLILNKRKDERVNVSTRRIMQERQVRNVQKHGSDIKLQMSINIKPRHGKGGYDANSAFDINELFQEPRLVLEYCGLNNLFALPCVEYLH